MVLHHGQTLLQDNPDMTLTRASVTNNSLLHLTIKDVPAGEPVGYSSYASIQMANDPLLTGVIPAHPSSHPPRPPITTSGTTALPSTHQTSHVPADQLPRGSTIAGLPNVNPLPEETQVYAQPQPPMAQPPIAQPVMAQPRDMSRLGVPPTREQHVAAPYEPSPSSGGHQPPPHTAPGAGFGAGTAFAPVGEGQQRYPELPMRSVGHAQGAPPPPQQQNQVVSPRSEYAPGASPPQQDMEGSQGVRQLRERRIHPMAEELWNAFDERRQRKEKTPWSAQEISALIQGVTRVQGYKWADIKAQYSNELRNRTQVQLKDKWRNLSKQAERGFTDVRNNSLSNDMKRQILQLFGDYGQVNG